MPVTKRVNLAEFAAWAGVAGVRGPVPLIFVNHQPSSRLGHDRERGLQVVAAARPAERVHGGRDLRLVVTGDFDATREPAAGDGSTMCRCAAAGGVGAGFDRPGDHLGVVADLK